jgi:DNA-binding NarL/FixJ family response regulator
MAALAAVSAAEPALRARIVDALAGCGLSAAAAATPDEALTAAGAPRLVVGACDPDQSAERSALRELVRDHEELRVIVVCETRGGRGGRLALERWIDGFVFCDQLELALGPTAVAVLAGQAVVPRRMRSLLRRPTLSFREKQILALVVLGYTNGQIGARLFLAESTVKSHLSSSFAKLGVRSRSDAAALVLDPEESRGLGIEQIVESFGRAGGLSLAWGAG